jgi:hypothetical protein
MAIHLIGAYQDGRDFYRASDGAPLATFPTLVHGDGDVEGAGRAREAFARAFPEYAVDDDRSGRIANTGVTTEVERDLYAQEWARYGVRLPLKLGDTPGVIIDAGGKEALDVRVGDHVTTCAHATIIAAINGYAGWPASAGAPDVPAGQAEGGA